MEKGVLRGGGPGGPEGTPRPLRLLEEPVEALRASSELRGAGGPTSIGADAGTLLVPSRATVTRGINELHSLTLSFMAMRTGMGLRHWKRMDGSKLEHMLAAVQLGVALGAVASEVDVGRKGCRAVVTPGGGDVLDEARQAGAGDVDGGRGPNGLGRSSR